MCAISGLFRFRGTLSPLDEAAVHTMTQVQSHRGPDDEGFFRHPRCALGHRRLSILDPSLAGHQPWAANDGKIQLVYNGEIYNFPALRRELEAKGARFRSQTDTEVIAQGYQIWGLEVLLGKLRGMFAFALLDLSATDAPRLILARDRFGIKPLYYAQTPDVLLFASEVRALTASGLVPLEQDPRALVQFLQLGSVPSPLTTIKSIRSLPAGHAMTIAQEPANSQPYWRFEDLLDAPRQTLSTDQAIHETRRLLEETVQQHLLSDVPVGIFLSGGIDSSALVGLARQTHSGPLITLSVVFDEARFDESSYARLAARQYNTDHREVRFTRGEWTRRWPDILKAMDQPSVDGVNTWVVSDAARQAGLKVVLSGLGADELFSGYRHLQQARAVNALVQTASWIPSLLRRPLVRIGTSLGVAALQRKGWCFDDISPATPYWLARGLYAPEQISRLTGLTLGDVQQHLDPGVCDPAVEDMDAESRMRWMDYHYYLQNQLLKDSDVMSMAHSIELRVPFLDHELVGQALSMPSLTKESSGMPKPLLVRAMGDAFPREIWDRPKQGFTFPFEEWLNAESGPCEEMALAQTPLDPRAVRDLWADFRAGRVHWSRPWMTLVAARAYGH